jgi:hypothetical protein
LATLLYTEIACGFHGHLLQTVISLPTTSQEKIR